MARPYGLQRDQPARQQPQLQIRGAQSSSSILVNSCQRGNPVLQHIKGVAWEYADIVPDYQVGLSNGVLFLSLRYHRLHPEYIHMRIQKLAHMYTLRILLVVCDVDDHQAAIRELTKVAIIHRMVLMIAWSAEEAAQYLESYKAFEQTPPDLIRARVNEDPLSVLQSVLTNVRGLTKPDVLTLATRYNSQENLLLLPGMGDTKARHIAHAFREPFRASGVQTDKARHQASNQKAENGKVEGEDTESRIEVAEHRSGHELRTETREHDADQLAVNSSNTVLDSLPDNFESLPEDEQLRIAMELSME